VSVNKRSVITKRSVNKST